MSAGDKSKEQLLTELEEMRHRIARLEAVQAEYEVRLERLHKSEAKFQAVFNRAGIGIALVNAQGRIVESNPAFQKLLGYNQEEMCSLVFTDFTHPDDVSKDWHLAQGLLAGKYNHYQMEKRYIRQDGQIIWGRLTVSLVQETGTPPQFTVRMVENITRRKQAEVALHQYAANLETRNEELNAYAHTVAHDLKNPLGIVIGYAELLEKEYMVLAREELPLYLGSIAQNGRKMNDIIDALLLLASVRRGDEVELAPLDMGTIVAEAQGRLARLIEEYRAEIILPPATGWPAALGYAPWVEQVWINYLSNAIKYGGRPPRVELGAARPSVPSTSGEKEEGKMVRFWVRDNGPGLTPEEQARLFTPFTQLHQTRVEGHGLGLSIVQRIVTRLGGQVGVESPATGSGHGPATGSGTSDVVPGRGSTFWFTLPGVPVNIEPTDSSSCQTWPEIRHL